MITYELEHVGPAVVSALETTAETARFLSGTADIALRAPAEIDTILAWSNAGAHRSTSAPHPVRPLGCITEPRPAVCRSACRG